MNDDSRRIIRPPTVRRLRLVHIPASSRPLWQERHWIRMGNRFTGAFRTSFGAVVGEIILEGGTPSYFIHNPPETLLRGPHGPCFRARGGGRFWVHWADHRSRNIDAGIMAVEELLTRAFKELRRIDS